MAPKVKEIAGPLSVEAIQTLETELARIEQRLDALASSRKIDASVVKIEKQKRTPGRFKGALAVGPEFFKPLNEDELKEFTGE
ncbi:hypothetical protein G6L37_13865 [Agrobacterium rubi]|uniref:hypothetical protein n=1 Tax=Agrobacterium rubi TaxID=28099 RepID=UPI001573DA51|nr:hypothetical protein [Agrobacterium rubi]NTF07232.1 hypothetical protein [Agrobacterium rubi]NTF19488.1 hypothetical protein [Agrobacterium rubi]NTF26451.1 hypothetical protein [Agrobacterium rubi]